jgi:hypothetical protein
MDALGREAEAALEALARSAAATRSLIDHEADAAGSAADGLRQELHRTEAAMAAEAREADESLDALADRMRSAGAEAEASEDGSASAIAALGSAAGDGARAVAEAVDGARASAAALTAAVEQGRVDLGRSLQALVEALGVLRAGSLSRTSLALTAVVVAAGDHAALVGQAGEAIGASGEQLATEVSAAIDGGLALIRDDAFPPVRDEIAGLGALADAAAETARAEADAVMESFRVVRDKLPGLLAGVDAVRGAASRVGLAWS